LIEAINCCCPHPSPLPKGEGAIDFFEDEQPPYPFGREGNAFFKDEQSPLPLGEGKGE